jgi:DNA polymerase-3 subunit beta
MKIQFDKQTMLKSLQRCVGVAEKKTTMPILGNVLWVAEQDHVSLSATDLEIGIRTKVEATVSEPGQICIPGQHLMNIMKELPRSEVTMETEDQSWVKISSGKAQFRIAALSGEEFPKIAKQEDFSFQKIQTQTFKGAMDKTSYAICTDEMRYNLNGSLIETEDSPSGKRNFKMVSTDGHRLAYYHIPLEEEETLELGKGVILPRKGIMEIKKIIADTTAKELSVSVDQGTAAFMVGDVFLSMKLVVGEFPDYTAVIPKNNDKRLKIDRQVFTNSLKRVSLLSEGKSKCVKFGIHGKGVLLKANSPELGEAEEEVLGEFDGGQLQIGFNAKYVMDILSNVHSEEIVLELNHEQSPGVFRIPDDPSFFGVVMPMRI